MRQLLCPEQLERVIHAQLLIALIRFFREEQYLFVGMCVCECDLRHWKLFYLSKQCPYTDEHYVLNRQGHLV